MKQLLLPLIFVAGSVNADDFVQCLSGLQDQARAANIAPEITKLIPELELQPRVLELDRSQPEFVQTFGKYLSVRVTDFRVQKGRELYTRHRTFLESLAREYGIPAQYLVAFWGLETNFGRYLGTMPTLDVLATLACDARRSSFFTDEFINALQLMEREALKPEQMRGSWAGAVGHTQFMPSSYLRHAVDGDGDGSINLWESEKDALASGANFLSSLGWQRNLRWGREISLPKNFSFMHAGLNKARSLQEWGSLGVAQANGQPLAQADVSGAILVPAGHKGPAFIVYDNFSVIMSWNRSESYALAVGHLADRIAGGGALLRPPPADQAPLARQSVVRVQLALNHLDYEAGEADGILGPATRKALSSFQRDAGLIDDGFPDNQSIEKLIEHASTRASE